MENNEVILRKNAKQKPLLILVLLGIFLVLTFLYLFFGTGQPIVTQEEPSVLLIYDVLPRIIGCLLVGSALAVSGIYIQAIFNNSLASPSIIGINAGSGFGFILISLLTTSTLVNGVLARSFGALVGGILTTLLIYCLAKATKSSRTTLVLVGIAISTLFNSLISIVMYFNPQIVADKIAFNLGSLSGISYTKLLIPGPIILVFLILAIINAKNLDVLTLGDEHAHSLGMNVKAVRFYSLIIASVLAASAVAISGLIGFLGLIVPHIIRRLVGVKSYRRLTILSISFATDLMLLCDFISKLLYGIPVGIFLSIIGIPFFIYLIFSKPRRNRYDPD